MNNPVKCVFLSPALQMRKLRLTALPRAVASTSSGQNLGEVETPEEQVGTEAGPQKRRGPAVDLQPRAISES